MRGKQHKIIAGRMMDPSTPAYAGQTSLIFAFRLRRSLYPRICGANTASDLAAVAEVFGVMPADLFPTRGDDGSWVPAPYVPGTQKAPVPSGTEASGLVAGAGFEPATSGL